MVEYIRQARRLRPQVMVFSLWRTLPAFLIAYFFFRKAKLCVFIHCSISVHWVDRLANDVMMRLADQVWADSIATLRERVPPRFRESAQAISMQLHRPPEAVPAVEERDPGFFIAWYRITEQKRVDRAIELIAALKRETSSAHFAIIGPDQGLQKGLTSLASGLKVGEEVKFLGPQDRPFIERTAGKATFFLQLSSHEGYSMAVVEAMQLGLIPVVTPVGMIPEYCSDGENAILFTDLSSTAQRLAALMRDPAALQRLSSAARETFVNASLYTDDVIDAASRLCGCPPPRAAS